MTETGAIVLSLSGGSEDPALPGVCHGAELREVRQQVAFALYAEEDDMQKVTTTLESLFTLLQKSFRP